MKYWALFAALLLTTCTYKKDILSETAFANKYLLALKKNNPSVDYSLAPDLSVNAKYNGSEYSHFPDNAYREYLLEPDSIDQVLIKFTQTANDLYRKSKRVNISKVIPVIKSTDFIDEVKNLVGVTDSTKSLPVFDKYNNELLIVYAEDSEKSVRYFTQADFSKLDINRDSILAIALNNLDRILTKVERAGDKGRYMVTAGGTYETSLLLINSFWSSKNFSVKGDIVVAVPNRDILLITGSNDKVNLDWMRARAQESYDSGSYQVSPYLFKWNGRRFLRFK
jgi:uncharacterized protein YtpQ (UPF0354 family)